MEVISLAAPRFRTNLSRFLVKLQRHSSPPVPVSWIGRSGKLSDGRRRYVISLDNERPRNFFYFKGEENLSLFLSPLLSPSLSLQRKKGQEDLFKHRRQCLAQCLRKVERKYSTFHFPLSTRSNRFFFFFFLLFILIDPRAIIVGFNEKLAETGRIEWSDGSTRSGLLICHDDVSWWRN